MENIPTAGRPQCFLPFCESITNNNWVLSIVRSDYFIKLKHPPPITGARMIAMKRSTRKAMIMSTRALLPTLQW